MLRKRLLLLCVALSGWRCSNNAILSTAPHATVSPLAINFGTARVGSVNVQHISVQNDGQQELDIKPVLDPSSDPAFSVNFDVGASAAVGAGQTIDIAVTWSPTAVGAAQGSIAIHSNSSGSTNIVVPIQGTAVTSTLQICQEGAQEVCDDAGPLTVDLGVVAPGQSAQQHLVLRAKGDASIHLASLGLFPTSDHGYVLSGVPAMPFEVKVGVDLPIGVAWTAATGGLATGQIVVLSDSDGSPQKVVNLSARGDAPRLCISASTLAFGDVEVSQTVHHTATLVSCGTQPLTITSATTAAPFSIGGSPVWPRTMQPGTTAPLTLTFTPAATGPAQKPLTFATNEVQPDDFQLTGNGVQCTLELTPPTLAFGQVSTSSSSSMTFTLTSTGYSDCTVTGLTAPAASTGFSIPSPPALPLDMPPGLQVPIEVDFQPSAAGAVNAQIEIDSDDSTAEKQFEQLTGEGVAPPPCDFTASPASVLFPTVNVGQSLSENVVVTNHGSAECYITGGGATGDTSFTATMPTAFPPTTIASGATVTIPVKFTPASSTLHTGTLTVQYSSQEVLGTPQTLTVPLQGGTLTSKLCLSPTLLDFGAVSAGQKPQKSFTISSCGDGTLNVRGIALAAGTSADFSLLSPPGVPLSLPKGSSSTITVQYAPSSSASAAGRVQVLSDDPAQPEGDVDLRGNLGACSTQLVCAPAALTFSTSVGRISAQSVTCTAAQQSVTVTGVVAAAGSDPDLTVIAGRFPVTLQPGGTLRADIQFAPTSAVAGTATFTFQTGGCGDGTVQVTALGTPPDYPSCPPVAAFTPKVKWGWNGGSVMTSWSNVQMSPVVANLTDDNGDGKIDENDIPDVIFASCSTASCCQNCADVQHQENADVSGEAVLRAVSGKDGSDEWTLTAANLHVPSGSMIAAADIDGDGIPEIIAVQHSFRTGQACPGVPLDLPICSKYISGSLLAIDHTGKLLWQSEPWAQPASVVENDSSLTVADLDQDGSPEIIFGDTVFDTTGHALWHMSGTVGNTSHGTYQTAADVSGSGQLALLAGPTAYLPDGGVLWTNSHVADGIDLVGDVDGDGKPDVLVRPSASEVVVLEGGTGAIKRDIKLPLGADAGVDTGACPAGPSMGDFLGDGRMELALPAGNWFYLIDAASGAVLWQKPIQDYDGQCGASGSAVFSFFGDGKDDIVYHDTESIWVWRGDGTEVYQAPRTSDTLLETPVIADIDNDGHAEILITNQGIGGTGHGLEALSDQNDLWPATRRIWSSWNYHVSDINENGTVPRIEQPFWKSTKLWRGNPPLCKK